MHSEQGFRTYSENLKEATKYKSFANKHSSNVNLPLSECYQVIKPVIADVSEIT